jgi:hypothetical protein
MFVSMNAAAPVIERSTWLSAARCNTAVGWCFASTASMAARSQMSRRSKV